MTLRAGALYIVRAPLLTGLTVVDVILSVVYSPLDFSSGTSVRGAARTGGSSQWDKTGSAGRHGGFLCSDRSSPSIFGIPPFHLVQASQELAKACIRRGHGRSELSFHLYLVEFYLPLHRLLRQLPNGYRRQPSHPITAYVPLEGLQHRQSLTSQDKSEFKGHSDAGTGHTWPFGRHHESGQRSPGFISAHTYPYALTYTKQHSDYPEGDHQRITSGTAVRGSDAPSAPPTAGLLASDASSNLRQRPRLSPARGRNGVVGRRPGSCQH